jgi:hypothetical protein
VSQRRNWSIIFLAASLVPSSLLVAFILWFMLWYRPSGQEQWGDAAAIAHFGALTYPPSLLFLGIGSVLAFRCWRQHVKNLAVARWLIAGSCLLLLAPWFLLWLGVQ